MRQTVGVVAACIVSLTGCYTLAEPDFKCDPIEPVGALHVVISPDVGPFGYGETVSVGDTLRLTAEVRPVAGASIDVWGSGGCRTDYGAPIPAAIEWSSSDTHVATVSAAGVVFGHQRGNAIITARAPARNITASREIGVWVRGGGGS
jgi:Big-like domain-containing protein